MDPRVSSMWRDSFVVTNSKIIITTLLALWSLFFLFLAPFSSLFWFSWPAVVKVSPLSSNCSSRRFLFQRGGSSDLTRSADGRAAGRASCRLAGALWSYFYCLLVSCLSGGRLKRLLFQNVALTSQSDRPALLHLSNLFYALFRSQSTFDPSTAFQMNIYPSI